MSHYTITKISPVQFQIHNRATNKVDYRNIQGTGEFLATLSCTGKAPQGFYKHLQDAPQYSNFTITANALKITKSATLGDKDPWKIVKINGVDYLVGVDLAAEVAVDESVDNKKTASLHVEAALETSQLKSSKVLSVELGNGRKLYHVVEDYIKSGMSVKDATKKALEYGVNEGKITGEQAKSEWEYLEQLDQVAPQSPQPEDLFKDEKEAIKAEVSADLRTSGYILVRKAGDKNSYVMSEDLDYLSKNASSYEGVRVIVEAASLKVAGDNELHTWLQNVWDKKNKDLADNLIRMWEQGNRITKEQAEQYRQEFGIPAEVTVRKDIVQPPETSPVAATETPVVKEADTNSVFTDDQGNKKTPAELGLVEGGPNTPATVTDKDGKTYNRFDKAQNAA